MGWPTGKKAANHIPAELETRVLALYTKDLLSTNQIGKRLGISKGTAARVVKEAGKLRFRRFHEEGPAMVAAYQRGLTGPAVAKKFNTSVQTVYGKLREAGIKRRHWRRPPSKCDHGFFDVIDSRLKAYLLGWMITDGCVFMSRGARRRNPSKPLRNRWLRNEVILSLDAKDAEIVHLLKQALKSDSKVELRWKRKQFGGRKPHRSREVRISVRSRRLAEALRRLGVSPRKTGRTKMAKGVPDQFLPDFWRGAIEGDGWLSWGKRGNSWQFVVGFTGDLPIVRAFQAYCQQHTPTRAKIQINGKKRRRGVRRKCVIYRFTVTDSYALTMAQILYRGARHKLTRKFDIYLSALHRYGHRKP